MSIEKLKNFTRILLRLFVERDYSIIYKNAENERATEIRVNPRIACIRAI